MLAPDIYVDNFLTRKCVKQSSQSQRCLGSLYWAWAVWAGKQICELLVQICCLAFLKICLKIQFCISNIQICFPAQPAQAQYGLPRQRWL